MIEIRHGMQRCPQCNAWEGVISDGPRDCGHCEEGGALDWIDVVAVEDVEAMLTECSRDFAGAHVNAGVVVGRLRKQLRDAIASAKDHGEDA